METPPLAFQISTRKLSAALLGMVLIAYFPALRGEFIWDDDDHVSNNRLVQSADGPADIWFRVGATNQYYPLTYTSFWIEYRLWGLHPTGYHLTNAGLHGINAILVGQALRHLCVPGAWVAAALFAVHPVHVESVAWISERKNVLSGFFYLSALLAYLNSISDGSKRRGRLYALSILLYVCALLSKTVTCTLPAVLLLIVWWKRGRIDVWDVARIVPMILLGLGFGALTVWVERHHVGALGPEWGLSMAERALIAGRAVWFYLWKLVWPHPLAFFYPRWPVDAGQFFQYLPPIAVLAVLAGLWRLRARWGKGPWVAAAYFLITLFPALGFFNVYPMRFSFVADHFQYLAAIGPIAMGAAGLGRMAAPPARLCSGLLIVLFGLLTWNQSMIYRSEERLWRDTIAQSPESWMPHENLGLLLVKQERFEEAARPFETAIRLKPDRAHAYSNLAGCLDRLGRPEEAQRLCEEAIRIDPGHVESHYNLGLILERRGRIEEAIAEYLASLKGNPHYVFARANLGMLLAGQGRPAEALAHLREAVRMAPERTEVRAVLDRVAAEVEQRRAETDGSGSP